jgi:hypothetical protein
MLAPVVHNYILDVKGVAFFVWPLSGRWAVGVATLTPACNDCAFAHCGGVWLRFPGGCCVVGSLGSVEGCVVKGVSGGERRDS